MTEGIDRSSSNIESPKIFSLRKATVEDIPFLFRVKMDAMRPVTEALHPDQVVDEAQKYEEYKAKFEPGKEDVVQYGGEGVGRLRVVRTPESIYLGGIQILKAFREIGIGTAIFTDLIEESKKFGVPIVLEVHDVNASAIAFYKKLGFEEVGEIKDQTVMRFVPTP